MGSPSDIDFVELGPGRGTLASDVVRLFQHFRQKVFGESKLSFRFVEVSETLSKLQYDVLCGTKLECAMPPDCYQAGYSKIGHFPMYWYRDLDSVPNDKFAFFLAHEFFDALPIHKFVKGKNGWRELYVDVKSSSENELQFVLLPEVTIATKLIKVCVFFKITNTLKDWNEVSFNLRVTKLEITSRYARWPEALFQILRRG